MSDEVWGVGRTFILAALIIIAGTVGMFLKVLTVEQWQTIATWAIGLYAGKSSVHAVAGAVKKKNGE